MKGKNLKTDQEIFWAGKFGDLYNKRNALTNQALANQTHFFSNIISITGSVESVIEFGSNIGLNLRAIRRLLPKVQLSAVEINQKSVEELKKWKDGKVKIYHTSILDFKPDQKMDLVFTKGVLIHINPEKLDKVYDLLYRTSKRYICIAEYYNPSPVSIDYRGEKEKLFKRDFCGEIMNKFVDLRLVDYGFSYHRDPVFPQDDMTWFLLEKKS